MEQQAEPSAAGCTHEDLMSWREQRELDRHLTGNGYAEVAEVGVGEPLKLGRPFPLTLDVDRMLRVDA